MLGLRTKAEHRAWQQKDMTMKTTTLVAMLRDMANGGLTPVPPNRKMLHEAADRLQKYEDDRVHGHATLVAYNLSVMKMQAKLLSDAADIFDQGGSQNTAYWNKHLGEVRREWEQGVSSQADSLRQSAFGNVTKSGFVKDAEDAEFYDVA